MPVRQQSAGTSGTWKWRCSLFVLIVAAIVWLGAVTARALIGNDILKPGTVEFIDFIDPRAEREVYRLISITSVAVMIGYAATVVSSMVFLATSPFRLKEHGWLLMSAILFYLFVPVEAYTLHLDWQMIYLEFYTTADLDAFRSLFIARVKALQGVPLIAMLCYYTIIGLAVFQPMKRLSPSVHET